MQKEPSALQSDRAGSLAVDINNMVPLQQQTCFLPSRVGIRHGGISLGLREKPAPRSSPQISETMMEKSFPIVRISAGPLGIKIDLRDDG